MAKVIMHIDMNAFFVRCEEIKNPLLEGKPVLIGHEGRSGIVSTASYAARKKGCHSGQPMFQALKACPEAIVLPPDFHFYSMMSNSFVGYLKKYSQIIERASIDECYVDMTQALKGVEDVEGYLRNLQNGLYEETKLRCSIGIAPTKWLAKMASDLQKPMGLTFLRKRDIEKILYPLPIEQFWGIGKKTSPRLRREGINTIGDLAKLLNQEDEETKKRFGKFYYELRAWIRGESSDVVHVEADDPKSISNQETLMSDEDSEAEVAPVILRLAEEVGARAKKDNLVGETITLQVKEAQFDEDNNTFHLRNKSVTFKEGTNDPNLIYSRCLELYRANFLGMKIRLVGVGLSRLKNPAKETIQMSLWNYQEYEEMDKTKLLIHDLNAKMENPMLIRASSLKRKKKDGDR